MLRAIGVEDGVRAAAGRSQWAVTCNWKTGRVISRTSRRQQAASFGIEGAALHRADLLDVLADALPAGVVTLAKRCAQVRTGGSAAAVRFTDGSGIEADVIVGADGIHSAVRARCSARTPRGSAGTWYKWALYDRDPMPQWTGGRVTLPGDAAHPMLPYLGQGACQAIEDGAVLATALLAEPADPLTALARYERTRRPRASRVVLASRERGLSNHLRSSWAAWRRDLLIAWRRRGNRRDPEGRGTAWLAGYDATSPDVLAA